MFFIFVQCFQLFSIDFIFLTLVTVSLLFTMCTKFLINIEILVEQE